MIFERLLTFFDFLLQGHGPSQGAQVLCRPPRQHHQAVDAGRAAERERSRADGQGGVSG